MKCISIGLYVAFIFPTETFQFQVMLRDIALQTVIQSHTFRKGLKREYEVHIYIGILL